MNSGNASELQSLFKDTPSHIEDDIFYFRPDLKQQSKTDTPLISVLILARDEGPNLLELFPRIKEELKSISCEYIVIDGLSNDETVSVAKSFDAKVFIQNEKGYANALRQGLALCTGQWILTLDGDGSHDPALIPKLLDNMGKAQMIVGSRWISGGSHHGGEFRSFLSRILNKLFQTVLDLPISDSSSGFRLFRKDFLASSIQLKSQDFSVLQELMLLYIQRGAKIIEVPIKFQERSNGTSKANLVGFAFSYIATIFRLWMLRNSALSSDYDDRAYNSKNPVQRWWQRYRFRNIHELIGENKNKLILDIGCGSSKIIQSMPDAVALDYSPSKLRFLSSSNKYRVCGSAFELPFKDNTFDIAINSQVIEHLADTTLVFKEIARVLKPGGYAIVGTVDYGNPCWHAIEFIYGILLPYAYADEHITHYTRKSLEEVLNSVGLSFIDERTIPGG
jgi:dolichol-phosphate mannosyltransferase